MWSDAIGITGEHEDFAGQDRHLLSNSTVFGLAKDLASMTHAQRVNAYCDLIRLLGVLYADLMRAMLRAEELADEEVLLQVTSEAARPTMAPHLWPEPAQEGGSCAMQGEEDRNECIDLDIALDVNDTDFVEGWLDVDGGNSGHGEEDDHLSHMQVAAKVGPTTAFASYLARLQAHFVKAWKGIKVRTSSTTSIRNWKPGEESG